MIAIAVKLFAAYQEAFQAAEVQLELPDTSCASDVLDRLLSDRPELERWRAVTQFAINLQLVPPETPLCDGDEVALIPPVSGG